MAYDSIRFKIVWLLPSISIPQRAPIRQEEMQVRARTVFFIGFQRASARFCAFFLTFLRFAAIIA